MIEKLTLEEYEEKIANSDTWALLDFWRDNCSTCQALSQELKQLADDHPDWKIFSINVGDEPDLVKKLRVMMAPTLLLVKGTETKKKSIGFKSKEHIIEMIEQNL